MTDPKPLTIHQLAAIEARVNAAEDGWHVVVDTDTYGHEIHGDGPTHVAVFGGNRDDASASYPVEANAQFAAHARADVPALLAEVARLKGQRKYLISQLAERDAESGRGDEAVRQFLSGEQPDKQPAVTITSETAAHVLFLECLGGWPPSTFGTKLLNLWTSADTGNAERLAVAFPEYGAAIALMRSGTDGIEQLRAIAGA